MKYVCAALAAVVLVLGWLYRAANSDLADARARLETARAVNEQNAKATERLERSMDNTDKALALYNEDRTNFTGLRNTVRQTIREAMRDETFKVWAPLAVPDDAWRLLREAPDGHKDGADAAGSPGRPDAGLPGNADSGKRQ